MCYSEAGRTSAEQLIIYLVLAKGLASGTRNARPAAKPKTVGCNILPKTMTAQERKENTEIILEKFDIQVNGHLPLIEDESEAKVREAKDVAKRLLILTYLNVAAEQENKSEIIEYLKIDDLWDCVSEDEKVLFLKNELTEQDSINISWKSESIYLMLWSLNKVDNLNFPPEQCKISEMLELIPDFLETSKDFIDSAKLRTTNEILDMSDLLYRLHWSIRQAELENKDSPANIDSSIVQERHYAINWITYYEDSWDDITTDT